MLHKMFTLIDTIKPFPTVSAHCDVPCGIYDPKPAQIAAATILKMVQKINELPKEKSLTDKNNLMRMIWTKEEHARICKHEILVLWTDYFKPEHVDKFPKLHETFWKAAKLVSKNKQNVDEEAAKELVAAVNEIAKMFEESKTK